MSKCNYSIKFYPLVIFNKEHMSQEDFETWMINTFNNAEKILEQFEGGSFSGAPSYSVSKREDTNDVVRTVISSKTDKISIDSLYIGHNDLKYEMEQRFAKDVVTRTVFDLFGTGE
jgi:hypothetical protein